MHQETNSSKIFKYLQEHYGKQLKILIIPYKRDMWDSFEGIYKIANSTEGCSADVMPIPYTIKSQTLSERWFIDDFSDVVQSRHTLDYQKKPKKGDYDVILIHNPYDEANYVTTVHPAFYSERLKGLSKCLALVPYGIGTICLITPGMVNCDITFVENEHIIGSFKSQLVEQGATEGEADVIAKRLVCLGTPKTDINLQQEIPEEWRDQIKGKRVVLLATSIQAFLDDPAGEMVKIGQLIAEISSDPDSVLIWREHPLLKPTIMVMRPQYMDEYGRFQKNYIDQGLGIFDRTHDYRIAFSVADVLYSDPSSLVTTWQTTGKEVHVI